MLSKIKGKVVGFLDNRLTTEHFTYQKVLAMFLPLFVDSAAIVLFGVLNTSMVSASGIYAISAVGLVDTLNMFLRMTFITMSMGGTVIVAQYKGQGNDLMKAQAASQTVTVVTSLALVIGAVCIIFSRQMLTLLFSEAEEEVMELAVIYLTGTSIVNPFSGITSSVNGALRGAGSTKASLRISVVQNVLNLCLNILFLSILNLSVQGLVYSSVISNVVTATYAIIYALKFDKTLGMKLKYIFRFIPAIQKKLMRVGIPFAMENLFFTGGKLLTQTFVTSMGTEAIAINTICNSLMSIIQCVGQTWGTTATTLVGQCMGKRAIEDSRKYIKSSMIMTTVFTVLVLIVFLPCFPLLMKLYDPEPQLISRIFLIVLMLAAGQPTIWPFAFVISYGTRAAGDGTFTSIASLASMWIVRVIIGYVLGVTCGFGIVGVWGAMIIEWAVRGLVFGLRFKGEKWHTHNLLD